MTLVKGRKLIEMLANSSDDRLKVFSNRWQGDYSVEDLGRIYAYQDELRKVWKRDPQAFDLVSSWVKEANKRAPYRAMEFSHTRVFVAPKDGILPLAMAIAVSDAWEKMAICGNPECPSPYFFKGRKTQRFCDRPACIAYGQREHKRNWWKENRAK